MRDDDAQVTRDLLKRVLALQTEVDQLKRAMETRSEIGIVLGLLAAGFSRSTADGWRMLRELSNYCNVRLAEVARLLVAVHDGTPLNRDERRTATRVAPALDGVIERARSREAAAGDGVRAAGASGGPARSGGDGPVAA
ncbi:ANTAR domain-containing protein [Spongisporangium articulatum]|uniref:ANTAR domain-containing protein n=1 Tax=Spongisporangium articulatum TaxID=3362603 RepID=A0ABW8AN82_9ACTN